MYDCDTGNDTVIRMDRIRKVFSTGKLNVEALRGIDLEVRMGEMVAVMGASGSGKSTLLNLIGCLDSPTDGEYELVGQGVGGLSSEALAEVRNRRIGFVFQSFHLISHLTAYQNVELPLLFGGIRARARRERVAELFEQVGLADRMQHKPGELSGGQAQRVAIARALAMDPDIVLADEPTGNLDSTAGRDVMSLLERVWERGCTVLIVTHDHELARRAPRRLEIHDGRVRSDVATPTAA